MPRFQAHSSQQYYATMLCCAVPLMCHGKYKRTRSPVVCACCSLRSEVREKCGLRIEILDYCKTVGNPLNTLKLSSEPIVFFTLCGIINWKTIFSFHSWVAASSQQRSIDRLVVFGVRGCENVERNKLHFTPSLIHFK